MLVRSHMLELPLETIQAIAKLLDVKALTRLASVSVVH